MQLQILLHVLELVQVPMLLSPLGIGRSRCDVHTPPALSHLQSVPLLLVKQSILHL